MSIKELVLRSVDTVLREYGITDQSQIGNTQVVQQSNLMDMVYELTDAGQLRTVHTHRDEGYRSEWVCASLILYNGKPELKLSSETVKGPYREAYPIAIQQLYKQYNDAKLRYN